MSKTRETSTKFAKTKISNGGGGVSMRLTRIVCNFAAHYSYILHTTTVEAVSDNAFTVAVCKRTVFPLQLISKFIDILLILLILGLVNFHSMLFASL